jgi:phospholipid/cholesterol/gamma-HCH transport system substrate-binding protein
MRRSFRERDPLRVGVLAMTTVASLILLTFNLARLPGGTTYTAAFTEASGLKQGEDVRIAGVKVGKVQHVGLEGDHVKVAFTVESKVRFGTRSRAQIKLSTLLGSHYLQIQPAGTARQSPHSEIPTSRTTPSYEVVPALQDLSQRTGSIDASQLSAAFDTLSDTLRDAPANVRGSLEGLRKVSRAVASRDDSLSRLLGHSKDVTRLLADRSTDLAALVSDGSTLLGEIDDRRTVIRQLLTGTVGLSQQISGTVEENRAALGPALTQLHRVVNILLRDQDDLTRAVRTLGPFVTVAGDATANGRWFDGYLQNLVLEVPPGVGNPGGDSLPIIP